MKRVFRVACECGHHFRSKKDPGLSSVQCGRCGSRNTRASSDTSSPSLVGSAFESARAGPAPEAEPDEGVAPAEPYRAPLAERPDDPFLEFVHSSSPFSRLERILELLGVERRRGEFIVFYMRGMGWPNPRYCAACARPSYRMRKRSWS